MNKYKLKYWYLATGMEGIADEYPEKIIDAESEDEAFYKYHKSNGLFKNDSFKSFMKNQKYVREWGTTINKIK